jgi:CubicO group peptidase (beta-lactamase class C family)
MAQLHVPAASVAVVKDMEIVWTEAWGVLELGQPAQATPSTLFQSASISKAVAAVGALCLVRDGQLSLDDDIESVLHSWHLPRESYTEQVTLRRLLSHSAGTGTPGFEGYAADAPLPTLPQMLDGEPPANSPAVRLYTSPGTQFSYSGGGYLIVQAMMEEVTGAPFAQVMRERVFAPLGMDNSHYAPLDPALHARAASGHVNRAPIPGKGPIHIESAPGGLWTTPSDLAMLTIEIMRAYQGATGPVLTPTIVQTMFTSEFWDFGLGVRVLGEGDALHINHGGATRGWHGQFIAYPARGESITVLTNGANGYVLWPEIERGIAQSLGWPGWETEVCTPLALSPDEIAAYTGMYKGNDFNVEVRSTRLSDDDSLLGVCVVFGADTWAGVPTEEDVFELLDFEGQMVFERAPDGEVQGMELWFDMPGWSPYRRWGFEKA